MRRASPISQIARDCGYEVVRKVVGMTPFEYRTAQCVGVG